MKMEIIVLQWLSWILKCLTGGSNVEINKLTKKSGGIDQIELESNFSRLLFSRVDFRLLWQGEDLMGKKSLHKNVCLSVLPKNRS